MKIIFLSSFLIWTPLILSNPVYIKLDDLGSYNDLTRKISETECYSGKTLLMSDLSYDNPEANAVLKLDLDEQEAIVAIGLLNKNKEYTHATVWKIPAERDRYTEVRFETLEQLIKIRESSSSSFGPYARFQINRNTLEGEFWSEFDAGVCKGFSAFDSSFFDWRSGKIIEEEEYRQLFNKIKIKDDEITQNFEETKKQTKKF